MPGDPVVVVEEPPVDQARHAYCLHVLAGAEDHLQGSSPTVLEYENAADSKLSAKNPE